MHLDKIEQQLKNISLLGLIDHYEIDVTVEIHVNKDSYLLTLEQLEWYIKGLIDANNKLKLANNINNVITANPLLDIDF